jgi:hypothetical protein
VLKDSQNTFVTNVENVSDPGSALLRQSRVDIKSLAVREQEEVDTGTAQRLGNFCSTSAITKVCIPLTMKKTDQLITART